MFSDARTRVAISAAYFVQGLAFAAVLTQVPVLQDEFAFSNGQLAVILFAVPVVAGVGSVLAGLAAERVGSAAVLRVAQPLVCLAALAAGVVPDRPALYVVLGLFGLGLGAVDATMNMQGVSLQHRYGRSILASFYAVWSLAGIAGALISSGNEHWRLPLWAGFGVVAVLGVGTSLLVGPRLVRRAAERDTGTDHPPAEAGAVGGPAAGPVGGPVVPWRPIVLIGVVVTLMYVADSATSNWSADYLRRALTSGATFAAWGYAAYQTCMLVGRLLADPLVRRYGPVTAVRVGAAAGTLGLLLVVAAPGAAVGIVGFGVLGLGLCVVVPESFSAAGRYDPTGSGLAVSRVNLFNYLGFLIGAPLVGGVEVVASWRAGFAVPLVLVAAIVPLAWVFRPRPARLAAEPAPDAAAS
jgi:MFS family permease